MSVTVHTVYLCSVTVLQCKWPRALLLLLNKYKLENEERLSSVTLSRQYKISGHFPYSLQHLYLVMHYLRQGYSATSNTTEICKETFKTV